MTSPQVLSPTAFAGADRMTLIRRTYALLTVSVLWTMVAVAATFEMPAVLGFSSAHPFITMFAAIGALMATSLTKSQPAKLGLLAVFVSIEGIALAPLMLFYSERAPGVITQAALLTGSTFAVLSLYAMFSRRDFSKLGGFLTIGLWVLIATSLLNMFFQSTGASLWLAAVTVFLFSGYIIYDTSRLKSELGPNDYVMATVSLYLDVLNLFLAILRILSIFSGGGRSRD